MLLPTCRCSRAPCTPMLCALCGHGPLSCQAWRLQLGLPPDRLLARLHGMQARVGVLTALQSTFMLYILGGEEAYTGRDVRVVRRSAPSGTRTVGFLFCHARPLGFAGLRLLGVGVGARHAHAPWKQPCNQPSCRRGGQRAARFSPCCRATPYYLPGRSAGGSPPPEAQVRPSPHAAPLSRCTGTWWSSRGCAVGTLTRSCRCVGVCTGEAPGDWGCGRRVGVRGVRGGLCG